MQRNFLLLVWILPSFFLSPVLADDTLFESVWNHPRIEALLPEIARGLEAVSGRRLAWIPKLVLADNEEAERLWSANYSRLHPEAIIADKPILYFAEQYLASLNILLLRSEALKKRIQNVANSPAEAQMVIKRALVRGMIRVLQHRNFPSYEKLLQNRGRLGWSAHALIDGQFYILEKLACHQLNLPYSVSERNVSEVIANFADYHYRLGGTEQLWVMLDISTITPKMIYHPSLIPNLTTQPKPPNLFHIVPGLFDSPSLVNGERLWYSDLNTISVSEAEATLGNLGLAFEFPTTTQIQRLTLTLLQDARHTINFTAFDFADVTAAEQFQAAVTGRGIATEYQLLQPLPDCLDILRMAVSGNMLTIFRRGSRIILLQDFSRGLIPVPEITHLGTQMLAR